MIAYFDTSAVIPLLVEESRSAVASAVWPRADSVVSPRLILAEGRAALARAARLGRLSPPSLDAALLQLVEVWSQLDVLEIDDALVHEAAALARGHSLRGYDAVHCAAALRVAGPETVVVAGDVPLLDACREEGLPVVPTLA